MATYEEKLKAIEEKLKGIGTETAGLVEKVATEGITSAELEGEPGGDIDLTNAPVVGDTAIDSSKYFASLSADYEQMKKDLLAKQEVLTKQAEEQAKTAETEKVGYLEQMKSFLTQRETAVAERPSTEELLKTTLAEYGLTPEKYKEQEGLIAQMTSLNQQIATLKTQAQTQMEAIGQQPISMFQITGHQAAVKRQSAIEIAGVAAQSSVIATQLEAMRGNFTQARQIATSVVNAVTYDQQQTIKDMEWGFDTYSDLFAAMDKQEKDAWNAVYNLNVKALEDKKDEIEKIMDLLIENPEAGILVTDSLTEASKKVADWKVTQPEKIPDTFWAAINRGVNELQQGEPWGNVWNRIKMQFPNIPHETINQALGTSWREPGAFEAYREKSPSIEELLFGR